MPLDPMTIVFGLVALFVAWKLRSVLGERTGFEKPPRDGFAGRTGAPVSPSSAGQNVIRLPTAASPPVDPDRWHSYAEAGSPTAAGLDAIVAADPAFAVKPFLDGAKTAYEAIVTAFAAGDRKTLQNLLARDVYDSFNSAVVAREKRLEVVSTTFVSIAAPKIEAAHLEGRTARLSVRFVSKQISATHGQDGTLIDGSPDQSWT